MALYFDYRAAAVKGQVVLVESWHKYVMFRPLLMVPSWPPAGPAYARPLGPPAVPGTSDGLGSTKSQNWLFGVVNP
jgi:hypothetical protein